MSLITSLDEKAPRLKRRHVKPRGECGVSENGC